MFVYNKYHVFVPFFAIYHDDNSFLIEVERHNKTGPVSYASNVVPFFQVGVLVLNLSPEAINYFAPDFITSDTLYYIVRMLDTEAGQMAEYRFDIGCEPTYTNYTLCFLNKLGGFDTVDFNKVSRKSLTVEKTEFNQLPYKVYSDGTVAYRSGNTLNETNTVYASQFTEKMTLNTDILSDQEYEWLGELIVSPLVYVEINGYWVPVSVKAPNYEYRKAINDKLTNLTIEVEFGNQLNTQYR